MKTKIKLYIIKFNPNGFSIVAADDRVKPVLAYSLDNEINLDYLPPQLLRILKSYQDGIDYVIDNNIESTRSIQNEWRTTRSTLVRAKSLGLRHPAKRRSLRPDRSKCLLKPQQSVQVALRPVLSRP